MTEIIANQLPGKLAGFISSHRDKSFLINFPHGLGDIIMFYPCFERLRSMFPGTRIDIVLKESNKESGFYTYTEGVEYDYVAPLEFYMSTATSGQTKVEFCCARELGITPPYELTAKIPTNYGSPLVVMGFHSNCFPIAQGCPKSVAKEINQGILDAGYIPLLLHFKSDSMVYEPIDYSDIVTASTNGAAVTLRNLFGTIQRASAFIGVNSGPMWAALSILGPQRCLCLDNRRDEYKKIIPKNRFKFTYQYDITKEYITEWLKKLPNQDHPR